MAYLIGAVLAIVVGLFGLAVGFDRSRAYYPVLLIVVASYYALFAVMGGSVSALWQESLVLAAFVAASVIGFRFSLWIVAAGLLAHGALDAVHPNLIDNPGAPAGGLLSVFPSMLPWRAISPFAWRPSRNDPSRTASKRPEARLRPIAEIEPNLRLPARSGQHGIQRIFCLARGS